MENTKKIKSFGKVLYVLAVIGRVCLYIGAVCLILTAIVIPVIFSKVDIGKNRVAIVGIPEAKVEMYKDEQKQLNIVFNDKKVNIEKELDSKELLATELVFDMLTDTTKEAVVVYIEASIIFSLATLVLTILAIKNFEKFSKNIKEKEEVFEQDNSKYLKNTAKFMLISYIVSLVASTALSGLFTDDFKTSFNTIGVIEILVIYLFAYVFAYGNTLEKKLLPATSEKPKTPRKKATKKEEK